LVKITAIKCLMNIIMWQFHPSQLKKPTGGKVVNGKNLSTHVNVEVLQAYQEMKCSLGFSLLTDMECCILPSHESNM
jgi:hypothetical protein